MANTSSAKKAQRVAGRRRVINARRQKAMKTALKGVEKLIASKKLQDATAMLPTFYKAVDKAVKNGIVKKNTAARMKSRAAKALRAIA